MGTLVLVGLAATFLQALAADRAWQGAVWFTTIMGTTATAAVMLWTMYM
jgi:hypothetical protein